MGLLAWFELQSVAAFLRLVWRGPDLGSILARSDRILTLPLEFGLFALWEVGRFLPFGFMAAVAFSRAREPRRWPFAALLASLMALSLATAVRALEIGWPGPAPGPFDLFLPGVGCMLGVLLGTSWQRKERSRYPLGPRLARVLALLMIAGAALLYSALDTRPLPFEPTRSTSAEKRRIYYLIESRNPKRVPPGETRTLRLTERDLDVILAWGISGLSIRESKAKAALAADEAGLLLSARLPLNGHPRYLNLTVGGELEVEDGRLRLHLRRLRVGRVETPRWVLSVVSPLVSAGIVHERRLRPLLVSTRRLTVDPEAVEVTYTRADLPPGLMADAFHGERATHAVLPAVRAQIIGLLDGADGFPVGEGRAAAAVEAAFTLARARSRSGEAALENRAAVLALGVVLGHWRIGPLVGPVVDSESWPKAARAFRETTLRGRKDWTRHFFVSAALALVSTEAVSDEAGLFKEELDADKGGSGFSFADLLADRAGTAFALAATRDEDAARAMQDRLARGFRVEAFFPPAADLPEGIADAELQAGYGGVGGEGYRRLSTEIEKRVAACAAYRDSDLASVTRLAPNP